MFRKKVMNIYHNEKIQKYVQHQHIDAQHLSPCAALNTLPVGLRQKTSHL